MNCLMVWLYLLAVACGYVFCLLELEDSKTGLAEYCQLDTFRANCPQDSVIVVTAAQYGRTRLGRCIKESYGQLSCSADVLRRVDGWCSGRRSCEFLVSQLQVTGVQPCPTDLTPALDIAYGCVALSLGVPTACDKAIHGNSQAGSAVMAASGYIGSVQTEESTRGGPLCPWIIAGQPGQVINITLVNFSTLPASSTSAGAGTPGRPSDSGGRIPRECYQLATVRDGTQSYPITECDMTARKRHILLSKSASVDIVILAKQQSNINFLIFYQVIGCADVALPAGSWATKSMHSMTVFCNNSSDMWQLTCQGGQWQGSLGNCTTAASQGTAQGSWTITDLFAKSTFPFNLLLIVSVGVALGVFLGGLLLVCISRKMKRHQIPGPAYTPSTLSRSQPIGSRGAGDVTTLDSGGPGGGGGGELSQYDYMFSCVSKTSPDLALTATSHHDCSSCSPSGTKLRGMTPSRYAYPPQAPSRDLSFSMRMPVIDSRDRHHGDFLPDCATLKKPTYHDA